MNEIKVVYGDIDEALSRLKSAVPSEQPSFPSVKEGSNVLDVITKLKSVNESLRKIIQSYQTLLLENEKASEKAVQSIHEAEEKLASSAKEKR
ncbi:YwqI/YxiC family protein [Fictibacillus sp. Mic-4]|uniref:YwqI/YxiC family protein n=1 Tax=Fictibacillus TaxID=1329200 RepID=UPI00041AFDD8|nr:YwqI/YxiC family protein [Fictibacillus gelatini]